ncbi:MAG TPA: 50S ribosomal protein L25 [Candidatus Peribacteraceae bacterium]|nr:50S ribosomal protein L25 [Candidatus Peribacteraceae bacterium]
MTERIPLKAAARPKDTHAGQLRRSGQVPGVVYGNTDNTLFSIEEIALKKAYTKAGESTLVELDIEGKTIPVLFQSVDFDPVSDRMIHVDFYAVDMKKEVEAEVHIRFENESPAVKESGAILVTALHEVTVSALPANLPHDIALDLSKLVEMEGTLTVADLIAPQGVTILDDPETVIVIAQEPREEEPETPPPAAEGAEGAPVAEGAAAPAGEGAPAEGEKE